MRVVLATSNAAKLRELTALLAPWQVDVLPQTIFIQTSVAETGLTFIENALLKARHAAGASGLPAIADDSGLEVDALGGGPGIYSARFAGPEASDAANLDKLLHDLDHVPHDLRAARYRCALVYLRSAVDAAPVVCQASWEGRILRQRRGTGGFGYDPVFEVVGLNMTAAELPAAEKESSQPPGAGAAHAGTRTRILRGNRTAGAMNLACPPLALYVHIPWCVRKCPYCDFNSHQAPAEQIPEHRYIDALISDLDHDLSFLSGQALHSIFIGGGTPSLFSPASLRKLLAQIAARIPCGPDLEVTLEANPGTIEHGRFGGYREAGITRVSLGVQSFDPAHLKLLGRIHSPDEVFHAVDQLRSAGLGNFNLDLMYALPGQTVAQALVDVSTAIGLKPAHLSHYQLTLEPGTPFYHRPPAGLPDQELAWDIQTECQAMLAANGFEQYEISAYAQQGRRCLHNLNYWRFGDYLGIGAGAHGKVTNSATGRIVRTIRHKQPRAYLAAASAEARLSEVREVPATELPFEFMLNALRLREGFSPATFEVNTGLPVAVIEETLQRARGRGLLESDGSRWQPSDLGWRFLNDLQELFLA